MAFIKVVNGVVVQKSCSMEDGFVTAPDTVVCGQILQNGIYVNPPQNIAAMRASKNAEIEFARDAACFGNVTAIGRTWQADERSQKLLNAAITLAQAGLPLPSVWRDAANSNMDITSLADLLAIAGAMAVQTQAAYSRSWALKAEIAAATTVEQVEAVTW